MSNVKENFLRYVQIETTSSETSGTCPSTPNQWVLAKMLVDELHAMGIENARVDDHCYVYATIPAKGNHPAKVGLISHMDTSDGVKGPTHPVIIEHYDGRAITLKNGVVIDGFPFLKDLQGQELIVTSGDSVLGADDKAGVAEIMALCKRLTAPDAPEHCTVCIGFTPDEEIGSGADHFDVAGFGADYAYTVDGGALGELEYENFNAASCAIKVHGVNIHPGSAKNQMRNALLMAIEWNSMLPPAETPAHTCGYEGFYHLMHMEGDEELATLQYIIRDHDAQKFDARKQHNGGVHWQSGDAYDHCDDRGPCHGSNGHYWPGRGRREQTSCGAAHWQHSHTVYGRICGTGSCAGRACGSDRTHCLHTGAGRGGHSYLPDHLLYRRSMHHGV